MARVVSKAFTKLRSLWSDLADKESRDEYVSARIATDLAYQIFSMREQRGWTQEELANLYGGANSQARISKLETSCESLSLNTLKKIASAFDVGMVVKFVPFSQMAIEAHSERLDKPVPSFMTDTIEAKPFRLKTSVGRSTYQRPMQKFGTPSLRTLTMHSADTSQKVAFRG